ncbi:MAG: acyltransferase [Actinomycetota bacterium]|nr:acyltransferase [Actinomycetota bacterium]
MTDRAKDLLEEIQVAIHQDGLVGRGDEFLGKAQHLVDATLTSGDFFLPPDPFKGDAREGETDPDLYYTMFWRMFDKTPASMIQGFAIPLRRLLAKRLFKQCGDGVIFHHNVLFSQGKNISLGNGVLVNRNSMLDDRGPIEVGPYTMIAAGVTIETHTHPFDDFKRPIAYAGRGFLPVTIGANSVIGYNAVLTAGSSVGYRAIVGANSVVTSHIPDYTVAGGVPAKPIKEILPSEGDPVREALAADPDWRDPRLPE